MSLKAKHLINVIKPCKKSTKNISLNVHEQFFFHIKYIIIEKEISLQDLTVLPTEFFVSVRHIFRR